MKLRLNFDGHRKALEIDDRSCLQDLRTAVIDHYDLRGDALLNFQLSLNGTDAIEASAGLPLSEVGIVHQDVLHILLPAQYLPSALIRSKDTENSEHDSCSSAESLTPEVSMPTSSTPSDPNNLLILDTEYGPHNMECSLSDDDEAIRDGEVNKYLREPMLVSDSTSDSVPWALYTMFHEANVSTDNEAICVLVHVLMCESGFSCGTPRQRVHRDHISCPLMPTGWQEQKTHRLNYNNESCPGVLFTVISVVLGNVIMVHGAAAGVTLGQKCQFQFQPSDYIITINGEASKTYKNLVKFSRLFKDKVSYPLIQLCRQGLGQPNTIGLLGLMEELKVLICSHLDAQSLCHISQTTYDFHRVAMQPKLWRRLYLRNFGRRTNNALSQDWFKLYKEKYILRREMRTRMHQARYVTMPRFVPPPFSGTGDMFPFNPGFGGDYDIYPAIPGRPGIPGMQGRIGPGIPRPRFDPFGALSQQRFPPWNIRWGGAGSGRGRGRGGGAFGGFFM